MKNQTDISEKQLLTNAHLTTHSNASYVAPEQPNAGSITAKKDATQREFVIVAEANRNA